MPKGAIGPIKFLNFGIYTYMYSLFWSGTARPIKGCWDSVGKFCELELLFFVSSFYGQVSYGRKQEVLWYLLWGEGVVGVIPFPSACGMHSGNTQPILMAAHTAAHTPTFQKMDTQYNMWLLFWAPA